MDWNLFPIHSISHHIDRNLCNVESACSYWCLVKFYRWKHSISTPSPKVSVMDMGKWVFRFSIMGASFLAVWYLQRLSFIKKIRSFFILLFINSGGDEHSSTMISVVPQSPYFFSCPGLLQSPMLSPDIHLLPSISKSIFRQAQFQFFSLSKIMGKLWINIHT